MDTALNYINAEKILAQTDLTDFDIITKISLDEIIKNKNYYLIEKKYQKV